MTTTCINSNFLDARAAQPEQQLEERLSTTTTTAGEHRPASTSRTRSRRRRRRLRRAMLRAREALTENSTPTSTSTDGELGSYTTSTRSLLLRRTATTAVAATLHYNEHANRSNDGTSPHVDGTMLIEDMTHSVSFPINLLSVGRRRAQGYKPHFDDHPRLEHEDRDPLPKDAEHDVDASSPYDRDDAHPALTATLFSQPAPPPLLHPGETTTRLARGLGRDAQTLDATFGYADDNPRLEHDETPVCYDPGA
jgi:hypothetical protein